MKINLSYVALDEYSHSWTWNSGRDCFVTCNVSDGKPVDSNTAPIDIPGEARIEPKEQAPEHVPSLWSCRAYPALSQTGQTGQVCVKTKPDHARAINHSQRTGRSYQAASDVKHACKNTIKPGRPNKVPRRSSHILLHSPACL